MKYFKTIKEKLTWINFYKFFSFWFYTSFVIGVVYTTYKYGIDIPKTVSQSVLIDFLMGSVFSLSAEYLEKKEENEETAFIIEEMRNEIEQLKEKIGE